MKKQKKSTVTKRLDKLWSQIVRSKGQCEVCGQTENLNAHHIMGRRFRVTRWDLKNGCCLCAGCHTFRNQSAHQDGLWFADWMKKNRPEDVQHLNERRWKIKQFTIEEMLLIEEGFKTLIK